MDPRFPASKSGTGAGVSARHLAVLRLLALTLVSTAASASSSGDAAKWNGSSGSRPPPSEDRAAQGIHLLLRPPDLLSPSLTPSPPSRESQRERGDSPEEAWASGDYVETLSLALPDGEDPSPTAPLPYDDEGERAPPADGARPRRPAPPLRSRPPVWPSSSTPFLPPRTLEVGPDVFPAWDDDYDPEDLAPLRPTELLLPDMNSLEYYTNLLAEERGEGGRRETEGKQGTPFSEAVAPPASAPGQTRPPTEAPPDSAPPALGGPVPRPSLSAVPAGESDPPSVDVFGPSRAPPAFNESVLPTAEPTEPARVTGRPEKTTAVSAGTPSAVTAWRAAHGPPSKRYLCNITKPDSYLVRVGGPRGSAAGFGRVRDLLRREFNTSLELQFSRPPSSFAFRAVSGPLIYTAISVINALRGASRLSGPLPAVSAFYAVPDVRYHVHTVLLFVPAHVDVRLCNFSERVETGLATAYGEARRRSSESGAVSVQLLNITLGSARPASERKLPVDVVFAARDGRGYLPGFEVSRHLRKLSPVEFSFYVGFPALQIAEPFRYPELNTSHHLRSTWVRTVLLGVPNEIFSERSFKARVERRLASLLEEGLGASGRKRWRRATAAADGSLQVVRVARLSGSQLPLEIFYFAEGPEGARIPAEETAETLNGLDLQRAAIVLGHRVRRPLAQPVETAAVPPSETRSGSVWLIVGVIVPVSLALFIVVLLYWKLCGSEKLEFQPDAINAIQQRQKLQASSVKGFDFAKLHLGQHSKDDTVVIQESGAPPAPPKEAAPSDGGDLDTPKSKGSSAKTGRSARRRGRTGQSDADSLGSDRSSGRESAEESTRAAAAHPDAEQQQQRKTSKNGQSPPSPPAAPPAGDEPASSSSIFEHVDRLSRGSSDAPRRPAGKVQLIATRPRADAPPEAAGPSLSQKVGTEVALRHKSEMEQRRNKLRQRAKRRGQCEFPSMDDIMDAFGDGPARAEAARRPYGSARDRADRVPGPDAPSPPTPAGERGRRSPRGRRNPAGSLPDTDRDRLLLDQGATYRKYPGLNNVAYMSDPDLPTEQESPSPIDEVFEGAPPPPPYVPPRPSIEEARQQMRSLLDDAFALVSPSSRGLSPALPGPAGRQWGSYPTGPFHSPLSTRYAELGVSPTSGPGDQGHPHRQSSGGFASGGERLRDPVRSGGGQYEQLPSSSRPRPVGGSAGVQLQHLTQVGLSSQMGAYAGAGRGASRRSEQRSDREPSGRGAGGESASSFPEFSSFFRPAGPSLGEPSAPPLLLTSPPPDYLPEDASPSARNSASLIEAIREELRRLARKQEASGYP
nr:UPF0606 protein KIAA1549-like [Nerophis lumbriciformis]